MFFSLSLFYCHSIDFQCIYGIIIISIKHFVDIKGNAQFVQKVTFEALMDIKQNHFRVGNIIKVATFERFLHLSY